MVLFQMYIKLYWLWVVVSYMLPYRASKTTVEILRTNQVTSETNIYLYPKPTTLKNSRKQNIQPYSY